MAQLENSSGVLVERISEALLENSRDALVKIMTLSPVRKLAGRTGRKSE